MFQEMINYQIIDIGDIGSITATSLLPPDMMPNFRIVMVN